MHDLPFKMHWKKMRANIHMPRSVQYPGLCFFFFSPCTLSSLIPSSCFFNKSIAMEGRGACKYLLLAALFLLIHAAKRRENRRGRKVRAPFPLLIVSLCSSKHCMIHNCSTPFCQDRSHRCAPGLREAVPPLQSAVLRGT